MTKIQFIGWDEDQNAEDHDTMQIVHEMQVYSRLSVEEQQDKEFEIAQLFKILLSREDLREEDFVIALRRLVLSPRMLFVLFKSKGK